MGSESAKRSFVKSLSWRLLSTVATILIGLFLLGSLGPALTIGLTDFIFKTLIHYMHERIWNRIQWKREQNGNEAVLRTFVKTASWRLAGTSISILAAFAVTHDLTTAAQLGLIDAITLTLLYFIHERLWNLSRWERPNKA